MPSLMAKFISWRLKRTVKARPLHLIDPKELRDGFDAMAPKRPPKDVSTESVSEGGVKGEWRRAAAGAGGPTILYLHGGGYVFGSPLSYRALTAALARACGGEAFALDYRLAPEHPYPAAPDDALAAYRWLLDQGRDPARIVVAGDSAGGGLTMALLLSIKQQGLPAPAGAVLFSPWTDLAVTGASMDENEATDAMFKKIYVVEGAKKYLAGADPKTPLASPLYGDLAGLPPIHIYASESEVLRDDAMRLHHRLQEAGVHSHLTLEEGLPHIWPLFVPQMPEARRTIDDVANFVIRQTNMEKAA